MNSKFIASKFGKKSKFCFKFHNFLRDHYGYIKRFEEYKDQCLEDKTKQTVSVVVYSVKNMINSYCRNPNAKRTKELIASASCANKITHDYDKCQANLINILYAIIPISDSKEKLAQLCW